jgi:hypothetical protein
MKHLTLFLLLISSLAFSQDKYDTVNVGSLIGVVKNDTLIQLFSGYEINPTPDTLRAIILVTLSPNAIAHARMGFVVIEPGKRPVYLNRRKRALKWPQVGWDWREVDSNYKK